MKPRFHIILENVTGKLDERFADTSEQAKAELLALIECVVLADGDTFRLVDNAED